METSEKTATRARSPERARRVSDRLASGDTVANLIVFLAAASIVFITSWIVFELYRNSAASAPSSSCRTRLR